MDRPESLIHRDFLLKILFWATCEQIKYKSVAKQQ